MKMYSLRDKKTKNLIRVDAGSNEGCDFCVSIGYNLAKNGEHLWFLDSLSSVKNVYENPSTPWYNASYSTPTFDFDMNDYEIVEVTFSSENIRSI